MPYPIGTRAIIEIDDKHHNAVLGEVQEGVAAGYREVWLNETNQVELISDDQILEAFDGDVMPESELRHHLKYALANATSDSGTAQVFARRASIVKEEFATHCEIYDKFKDSTNHDELQTAVMAAVSMLETPELLGDAYNEEELRAFVVSNASEALKASLTKEGNAANDDDIAIDENAIDEAELAQENVDNAEMDIHEIFPAPPKAQLNEQEADKTRPVNFQTEPLMHVSGVDALLNGVGSLFSAGASLGHSMVNVLSKRDRPGWLDKEVTRLARSELDALFSAVESKTQAADIATRVILDDPRIKEALSLIDHGSNSLDAVNQNKESYATISALLDGDLRDTWSKSCELIEEAAEVCKVAHTKFNDLDEPHDLASDMLDVMRKIKASAEPIVKLAPDSDTASMLSRFLDWLQEAMAKVATRFGAVGSALRQDHAMKNTLRAK